MFTRPLTGFTLALLLAFDAAAQTPTQPPAAAPTPAPAAASDPPVPAAQPAPPPQVSWSAGATGQAELGAPPAADASLDTSASAAQASSDQSGFESGLRLGIGVPLGKAGQSAVGGERVGVEREMSDLTPWRVPLWIDVGYRLSRATTLGIYAQLGLGGSGDDCAGVCNWSDLRVGAQGQWRLAPGASVNPWLGVGVGYEWLTIRTLQIVSVPDPRDPTLMVEDELRTAERLGGPELLLQGGVDFQVEDALSIGPYASATVGQYLSDGFKCSAGGGCPTGSSIEGSGFHSWLGVGLRGSYTP